MRYFIVIITLLFAAPVYSQQTDTADHVQPLPRPQQELGLMLQLGPWRNSPHSVGLTGIQYKRFKTEHLGYRVFAAYGGFLYDEEHTYISMKPDTVTEKTESYRADLAIAGVGLEAQRQFYKNIYLFAALELKAGYGTGYIDTLVDKTYPYQQGYAVEGTNYRSNNGDMKMFYAAFTPTIGAKIQQKRLAVGVELLPIHFTLRNTTYYGRHTFLDADFTMFDIATRVFVHYRF